MGHYSEEFFQGKIDGVKVMDGLGHTLTGMALKKYWLPYVKLFLDDTRIRMKFSGKHKLGLLDGKSYDKMVRKVEDIPGQLADNYEKYLLAISDYFKRNPKESKKKKAIASKTYEKLLSKKDKIKNQIKQEIREEIKLLQGFVGLNEQNNEGILNKLMPIMDLYDEFNSIYSRVGDKGLLLDRDYDSIEKTLNLILGNIKTMGGDKDIEFFLNILIMSIESSKEFARNFGKYQKWTKESVIDQLDIRDTIIILDMLEINKDNEKCLKLLGTFCNWYYEALMRDNKKDQTNQLVLYKDIIERYANKNAVKQAIENAKKQVSKNR